MYKHTAKQVPKQNIFFNFRFKELTKLEKVVSNRIGKEGENGGY